MGRKTFKSDDEVQQAVHEWLCIQQKDFFDKKIMHFVSDGGLALNRWRLYRKMMQLYDTFCFNKL